MKTICLDLTNIVPGVGGVGGGIATYGKSLVLGFDNIISSSSELSSNYRFIVLLNKRTYQNLELKNIESFFFKVNNQNLLSRMTWLHLRLPSFLKKEKVDLVHRVVSELPFRKVCKTVVTVHDFMFDFYLMNPKFIKYLSTKEKIKFKILNVLLYNSLKTGNQIVMSSQAVKSEALEKLKMDSNKIKLIPLAYDKKVSPNNDIKTAEKPSEDRINFGIVAAFHPHKGHLNVVRLAKTMVDLGYGDQIHFYFRGSPVHKSYFDEVKDLIHELNLSNYFSFEQYDPNITLEDIYKKYSATMLLSECEGFGLPVIEAQAFQRPVICSDLPVFREVLGDSAIFLSESMSDQQIHELFAKLRDEKFLKNLTMNGDLNCKQYSWSRTCGEVMDAYLEELEK